MDNDNEFWEANMSNHPAAGNRNRQNRGPDDLLRTDPMNFFANDLHRIREDLNHIRESLIDSRFGVRGAQRRPGAADNRGSTNPFEVLR